MQENRVERFKLTIKNALHVTVCAQGLLDVTDSTAFSPQFAGLEIINVFLVVEHESDGGQFSMDLFKNSKEKY